MSTVVEHTSGPRNRWLLPILLAIVVAAIILGAIFIPKLVKSAAKPTATVRVVVVTSSPGAGTAMPTPSSGSGTVVATTSSSGTGSTPLPGATPVPTHVGLVLGMITHPQHDVTAAQAGANRHDPTYTFRLDPRKVVQLTLPNEGFAAFQIVSPAPAPTPTPHLGVDKRPVIWFLISYQGQQYSVAVAQPAKQGPSGIWFVVTVLKGRHLS
jgi:hypothetical protein